MKTDYQNEHAHCRVQANAALPVGVLEVSGVFTDADYRGQGYATELLQAVCEDADIDAVVLALMPSDAGIQKFYERFGFRVIQPRPVLMARLPQIYKVKMSLMNAAVSSVCHGR